MFLPPAINDEGGWDSAPGSGWTVILELQVGWWVGTE